MEIELYGKANNIRPDESLMCDGKHEKSLANNVWVDKKLCLINFVHTSPRSGGFALQGKKFLRGDKSKARVTAQDVSEALGVQIKCNFDESNIQNQ